MLITQCINDPAAPRPLLPLAAFWVKHRGGHRSSGGTFAVLPAIEADLLRSKYIGAIQPLPSTFVAAATVAGPFRSCSVPQDVEVNAILMSRWFKVDPRYSSPSLVFGSVRLPPSRGQDLTI